MPIIFIGNESQIYSLCGIIGNSKITRFVKGLEEIKIKSFNYYPKIKNILDLTINSNIHILLINLYEDCQLLSMTSKNSILTMNELILDKEYYFENEMILDMKFHLGKYISLISKKSIILFELSYSELELERFKIISNFVL